MAIIKAIIALGKGLDLQIVAEGVESKQLKNLLETLNCSYMQGYFFSRPLNVAKATDLLLHSDRLGELYTKSNVSGTGFEYHR